MARWQPDARGRLEQAALELFAEHGYERTSVAGIAERAGLTERTFYRHFADKRDVLFYGEAELGAELERLVAEAPRTTTSYDAVVRAIAAMADAFPDRPAFSRRRRAVLDASPALKERELLKLTHLQTSLAEGLRRRGTDDAEAALAADTGLTVFRSAFDAWISQPRRAGRKGLADLVVETAERLRDVVAARS